MDVSILKIVLFAIAVTIAAAAGLLAGVTVGNRRIEQLTTAASEKSNELARQRDHFATRLAKAKETIASLRADAAKRHDQLESVLQQSRVLTKNVLALRSEREETKLKITTLQKTLVSVKQRTLALQREFEKAGDFYKGELVKSFDKRKTLEKELEKAQSEHDALAQLVESAVLEHGSPKEMITEAQLRLGQLKVLERNVEKLEKENQQLRDDAVNMKRDYDAAQKDLKQLDELKIYNKQLVDCVESLEGSRQQHEHDADKYREEAAQSEQLSETLRLKLEDLEKNFADIEEQQDKALEQARRVATR